MQGKWVEVDAILEEGLRKFPSATADRDRLFLLKAQTLILRGCFEEARIVMESSLSTISLYPSTISALYYLFDISGDSAGAESFLSATLSRLESAPGSIPSAALYASLGFIGKLYRERDMCAQAASVYQTVLSVCELNGDQRVVVSAKLVESLSHTEDGAAKYIQRLPEV